MREVRIRGRAGAGLVALVDDEDYGLVSSRRWYVIPKGYVKAARPHVYMHCLILGCVGIDHIDGNPLNNMRSNLRPATASQNLQNRHGTIGRSGCRGVIWNTQKQRWKVEHQLEGERFFLGYFDDKEEASRVATAWRAAHMPYSREARNHVRPERES